MTKFHNFILVSSVHEASNNGSSYVPANIFIIISLFFLFADLLGDFPNLLLLLLFLLLFLVFNFLGSLIFYLFFVFVKIRKFEESTVRVYEIFFIIWLQLYIRTLNFLQFLSGLLSFKGISKALKLMVGLVFKKFV